MAGPNSEPIYSKAGDVQWITGITAANNTIDITTGTSYLVFTADATNGGYVRELRIKASPSQNTAATVVRIWINNGSATGTKANSVLFTEQGLTSTTTSATLPQADFIVGMNLALPAGYRIYMTIGTAVGGSGELNCLAIAGKY